MRSPLRTVSSLLRSRAGRVTTRATRKGRHKVLAGFVAATLLSTLPAVAASPSGSVRVTPEIGHDISPPVSSMASVPADAVARLHQAEEPKPRNRQAVPGIASADTSFPATNIPSPSSSCTGFTGNDGDGVPPDPQIAVGTTQVLEAINSRFQVFNKPTGTSCGALGGQTSYTTF
ncbi:MAG: hypothetical protein ABR548_15725, partial [Actinomycetota bacterium]